MSIRIEHRKGRGIVVDINVMRPDGFAHRERRKAPIQDEKAAWTWAKRREQFLLTGRADPDDGCTVTADRPGHVYFVRGYGGMVKIGWAADVAARLVDLQVASPCELELVGSIPGRLAAERAMHRRFSHLWVRGEWFRGEGELAEYLNIFGAGVEQKINQG